VNATPVVTRLRRKIDELRDRIEELERELSRRPKLGRHCIYCGLPLTKRGVACRRHADLPALESELGL
jgi:hypothetical protein